MRRLGLVAGSLPTGLSRAKSKDGVACQSSQTASQERDTARLGNELCLANLGDLHRDETFAFRFVADEPVLPRPQRGLGARSAKRLAGLIA